MAEMSMLLNPAVRATVDWKNPASSFSPAPIGPRVAGLDHSTAQKKTVPPSSRTGVAKSTRRVFTVQRRGRRHSLRSW
jgi:hypothetical protein